jgi:1-phosphofructokinase family hexose kinase
MDRVEVVPELSFGRPLRAERSLEWPGGSGTHAALVARCLGVAGVTVVAPVGGAVGARWVAALRERGIRAATVAIAGATRSNVSVLDARGLAQLEVVEAGPTLDADEAARFVSAALAGVTESSVVVLSGSLPPGLAASLVTQVAERAHRVGATLVCDLGGAALGLALGARAQWVKANLDEMSAWWATARGQPGTASEPPPTAGPWQRVAAWLEGIGGSCTTTNTVLTMAGDGALWHGPAGTFHLPSPTVPAFNPIGCGDAMVGAMAAALCADLGDAEVTRWGVAAAAENLAHAEPGTVDRQRFADILDSVSLEPMVQGTDANDRMVAT